MPCCWWNGETAGAHGHSHTPLGDMGSHQQHQSVVAPGDNDRVEEVSWSQEASPTATQGSAVSLG